MELGNVNEHVANGQHTECAAQTNNYQQTYLITTTIVDMSRGQCRRPADQICSSKVTHDIRLITAIGTINNIWTNTV